MPSTCNSKALRKAKAAGKILDPTSVSKEGEAIGDSMVNENDNHSQESVQSRKRSNSVKSVITMPKRKCGVKGGETTASAGKTDSRSETREEADLGGNVTHFQEDGDHVSMDIDDGGLAAKEFNSETERTDSDSPSKSDGEISDENQGSELDADYSDLGDTSMNDNSQSEASEKQTLVKRNSASTKKSRRASVEDKLDNVTDTLHVMQFMLIKKGFYDSETLKKKRKGN